MVDRSFESENWHSLKREVDLFSNFFDTIPAHMYLKDTQSRFLKVNSAMRKFLKLSEEENVLGKSDFDFFKPEHAKPAYEDEQEIMRSGIPKIGYEEKEIWPDGSVTWALSTKMPVYNSKGDIIGLAGISQDITKQKEVELEEVRKGAELRQALQKLEEAQVHLVQSEKMASVGMLVAGIAHEMNNPLNYITGAKNAIEGYIKSEVEEHYENLKEFLGFIDVGVTRASNIVKGLNRFNRISDNYEESCDIHLVIENCLIMLRGEIGSKVRIEKRFTDQSFELLGNEGELHQVIINIINNGIQAIPKKGEILILTEVIENQLVIKIKDSGVGIKSDDLQKITNPFFTTKEPGKGTGLGTTISASIVKKHQGRIEYESTYGEGTTVTILLPISSD